MSIVSLALAGKYYRVSRYIRNSSYWKGSYGRVPVELSKGTSAEFVFVTQALVHDYSDKPIITLIFEEPMTSKFLRCTLSERQDIDRTDCGGEESSLSVDWWVWQGETATPSKSLEKEVGAYFTQSPNALALALFQAEPGKEYKVVLQVQESPMALQSMSAELEVLLHPDIYKQVYAWQGVARAWAVGFVLLAAIIFLIAVDVARNVQN